MNDSRNLRVLDAAGQLTSLVDASVSTIRTDRAPGAANQLARAVASIEGNISEASNLGTNANFSRQLKLALASAIEAGSHLRRIRRAEALDVDRLRTIQSKHATVCRMLSNLIDRVDEQLAHEENERRRGRRHRDAP